MQKEYLFVYGTLRKDVEQAVTKSMANNLLFIGTGKVKAELYDLGEYPGAVQTKNNNEIVGDVFELVNPEKVFSVLDEYEGEAYRRETANVKMGSGTCLEAWMYWYTEPTSEKKLIKDQDYLIYLKTKKTV